MKRLRDLTLRERVRRAAGGRGLTMEEVANMAQIPPRTLRRRLAHPGEMTLYEFHRLALVVPFTDAEKVQILDGTIS